MVDLWLEELLHLGAAILCGKFLGKSEEQLVLVSLGLLLELLESILEVLHGVVAQL